MEGAKLSQSLSARTGWTEAEMLEFGVTRPPTQDELPYSDGMPMESNLHVLQMYLLIETLKLHWANRTDVFVGGNMFVYFSADQERFRDFRGPDFFAVQGVQHRERKSWVVWEEGKGPDVVVELLSDSTAQRDKEEKKLIYQDRLRVPEYFWFHPYTGEWAGFALLDGVYQPILPDAQGRLISQQLQLALAQWEGIFSAESGRWLRWAELTGKLLPTAEEKAAEAQEKAAEAQENVVKEQEKVVEAQEKLSELEILLAQYRARFGELPEFIRPE